MKKIIQGLVTEDKGNGEVIIFLHGYLSNKESFIKQIDYFSKYYRVIAPDLTGFGENLKLNKCYSLDDYVLDVLNLINSLNIKKYHVLAHSFGGRIAIKLATIDNRIDKIIFTGSAGLKPKRSPIYYFRVYLYKLLKKTFKNKDFSFLGSKEYQSLSQIERASYVKIVNEHLDNLLYKINNKTLIINGHKDKATPKYMAKRLRKGIKNSQLRFISGNHFCFLFNNDLFNSYMHNFLKGG